MRRIVSLISLFCCTIAFAQQRFQFIQPKMGSPFNLIFYASDSATATALANESFLLVDSLNRIFSDYMENSELSLLNKTSGSGQAIHISQPLYSILLQSKTAAQQSANAFDVTIGPLSKLWRIARKSKKFPTQNEVQQAKQKVGIHNLLIDTITKEATLLLHDMQLDLGGIAKGCVAQQVINFLKEKGIASALADAGGDIACGNPPPDKSGWVVGINVPENETELLSQTILINNEAIATSGDIYQFIEHKGKRYSHIIDPRTGYGVSYQRNVTVLAKNGATADWLATACSILPLPACKKLVTRFEAELLITYLHNNKVVYFMTDGMKKRMQKQTNHSFSYFSKR